MRCKLRRYAVRQAGFSLLEMMVAVAILGVSLGMLYQAAGGAARNVNVTEEYAYAVMIAQSVLADNSSVVPEGVNDGGLTGDGYRWEVISTPIELGAGGAPLLHSVRVNVEWGLGRTPRQFSLDSVVPVVLPE